MPEGPVSSRGNQVLIKQRRTTRDIDQFVLVKSAAHDGLFNDNGFSCARCALGVIKAQPLPEVVEFSPIMLYLLAHRQRHETQHPGMQSHHTRSSWIT